MKTKILLLLAASAIVTLSFSFVSNGSSSGTEASHATETAVQAPVGGLVSER